MHVLAETLVHYVQVGMYKMAMNSAEYAYIIIYRDLVLYSYGYFVVQYTYMYYVYIVSHSN